jgi:phthiocerol/phenolphthiocerol synthesis type-I polyketide synthase D
MGTGKVEEGSKTEVDQEVEEEQEEEEEKQLWQFTGQGDLKVGCGRELLGAEESFRAALARCDAAVRNPTAGGGGGLLQGHTFSDVLYPVEGDAAAAAQAAALMAQTRYSQPALVALEFCVASVWLAQGLTPAVVMGHSLGALYAAVVPILLNIVFFKSLSFSLSLSHSVSVCCLSSVQGSMRRRWWPGC